MLARWKLLTARSGRLRASAGTTGQSAPASGASLLASAGGTRRSALLWGVLVVLLAGCGPPGPAVSEPVDPDALAELDCTGQVEAWIVEIDPSSGGADSPQQALNQLPDTTPLPPGDPVRVATDEMAFVHEGHYAGSAHLLEHEGGWFVEEARICR